MSSLATKNLKEEYPGTEPNRSIDIKIKWKLLCFPCWWENLLYSYKITCEAWKAYKLNLIVELSLTMYNTVNSCTVMIPGDMCDFLVPFSVTYTQNWTSMINVKKFYLCYIALLLCYFPWCYIINLSSCVFHCTYSKYVPTSTLKSFIFVHLFFWKKQMGN